jgi:hypothetical protein
MLAKYCVALLGFPCLYSLYLLPICERIAEPHLRGCAIVFATEAKIEIEKKISFRLEAKKGMLSLVSHRSETAKI